MDRTELQARLEFRRAAITELRKAYLALVNGQAQSYTIGSRTISKFDISKLKAEIEDMEKEIDQLAALASGRTRRKAVGVIPRDC